MHNYAKCGNQAKQKVRHSLMMFFRHLSGTDPGGWGPSAKHEAQAQILDMLQT